MEEKKPAVPFELRLLKLLQDAAELMRYMDVERVERVKYGKLGEWWQRYENILRELER